MVPATKVKIITLSSGSGKVDKYVAGVGDGCQEEETMYIVHAVEEAPL
jgi:hypothetical protein